MAYNKDAVDAEIRKDRRIKGKEARLIHAVLRGPEHRRERLASGARLERAEKALADAVEAGDGWAEAQNRKALRMAKADYARVMGGVK